VEFKAEIFDLLQLLLDEKGFLDHQLHCEISLSSPPDEAALRRAVGLSLEAFPILATAFSPKPDGGSWVGLPQAALQAAFAATRDEEAFEAARTFRVLAEEGPQVRFCLLGGRRNALAVAMNHMISDAAGFKDYLYFVCDAYSHLVSDPLWVPSERLEGRRDIALVLGGQGFLAKAGGFFGRGGGSNHAGKFSFPLAEGGEAAPFIATRTIDRAKADSLKAFCREKGATINDAALAAYYRVLARRLGAKARRRLEVPIMVDMRRYLGPGAGRPLTNLTSTVATRIRQAEGESFEATMLKAKSMMDGLKRGRIGLGGFAKLSLLFSALGARRALPLLKGGFRSPLISMTNIGEIDETRLAFAGSPVESAYICGSIKHKPHFQLALSGFGGTLTLSSNLYGSARDREIVEAFLLEIEEELCIRRNSSR
jgi:NRPS condensation-like uncharacterized protein